MVRVTNPSSTGITGIAIAHGSAALSTSCSSVRMRAFATSTPASARYAACTDSTYERASSSSTCPE